MRAELEASTDEEQDLFRQMIERIEEDGYGKKWCFGDYHESVSPLLARQTQAQHKAQLSCLPQLELRKRTFEITTHL